MATIFTRIAKGEIPSYKVAENEEYYAFLDIAPMAKGHTLVIPKNVKSIGSGAFKCCFELSEVTVLSPYLKDLTGVFDDDVKIIYAAEEPQVIIEEEEEVPNEGNSAENVEQINEDKA